MSFFFFVNFSVCTFQLEILLSGFGLFEISSFSTFMIMGFLFFLLQFLRGFKRYRIV